MITVAFWYEVVARYFLAAPTVWAYAVASYALCPMIFLAMPEMSRRGAHIAVGYFAESLPERWRKALALSVVAVTAVICLMCTWITFEESWRQFVNDTETMSAFPIPKWWVSVFTPYGLLSSAIYFARQLVEPPAAASVDEGF